MYLDLLTFLFSEDFCSICDKSSCSAKSLFISVLPPGFKESSIYMTNIVMKLLKCS